MCPDEREPRAPQADDLTDTREGDSGRSGDQIGPYHLLEKIGEGGMGEVWVAEQRDPVRRRVAVKVIKYGMDTRQVVARFEAERQALALMDHPGIAKVYDAGATGRGRPYFAMEYVQGEPITSYCDRHRLATAERLDLFAAVCDAVQHAHQKGVIHRDLKPSNVLVTLQDQRPVPKIIDFGIAKATAHRLTEQTLFTELGVLVGTPEYMSPEQAEMTGLDVDTRTDVYSLGVMLYELIAGALPFDAKTLRRAGLEEVRRQIRELEPPRPSTRVKTAGDESQAAARNRRTDPTRLASLLKGDLDWITMKALDKDRTRRYASASEMAADVRRHLQHQPVVAGPPSTVYRARKFVRRHRVGVSAATVLVLLLAAFATTATVQARRIARERDRANREAETAQRVSDFLVGLFKLADPGEARGNSVTAREILDRGAERVRNDLASQPEIQATMTSTMGLAYQGLGLYEKSADLLRDTVATRRRVLGTTHPAVAASLNDLGLLLVRKGDPAAAEPLLREALERRRALLGPDTPEVADTLNRLGQARYEAGDYEGAEKYFREALGMQQRLLGAEDRRIADSLNDLAMAIEQTRADYQQAIVLLRKALDIRRKTGGDNEAVLAQTLNNLAMAHYRSRDYDAAEPLFRESLALNKKVFGEQHPEVSTSMNNLALLLRDKGDYLAAEPLFAQVVEADKRVYGATHPNVAQSLISLADLLRRKKDLDRAEAMLRQALDIQRKAFKEDGWEIATTNNLLGGCLTAAGRYPEAERLLLPSATTIAQRFGPNHPRTRAAARRVAELYQAWGKRELAANWTSRSDGR